MSIYNNETVPRAGPYEDTVKGTSHHMINDGEFNTGARLLIEYFNMLNNN